MEDSSIRCPTKLTSNCAESVYYDDHISHLHANDVQHAIEALATKEGPQGAQGAQGPTGLNTGFQGAQGPQGAQGNIGPQGAQGSTGLTGSEGSQGAQGNIGPTGSSEYDAFVSPGGVNGEYALLSDAVSDGKINIFVREGTYVENTAINLTGPISITGQKAGTTIITFSGLATPAFSADGTGGIIESSGTISISNGTTTVTGVGTTFTNLSPGDLILLGGISYIISTITNDTSLTISEAYRGRTLSGMNYIAFPFIGGIHISGLSILNSTGSPSTSSAISFTGINRLLLKKYSDSWICK